MLFNFGKASAIFGEPSEDAMKGLALIGALITALIFGAVLQKYIYMPRHRALLERKKTPLSKDIKRELDYAQYLKWALENGQAPHFNK